MLSVDEKIELSHLEQDVERGREAALKMARALMTICDRRLYRDAHPSFEEYCEQRWNFSRQYAYNLISYGRMIAQLESASTTVYIPENEGQARPLKQLESVEEKQTALEASVAIASGNPNSSHIQRAVAAVKSKPQPFTAGQTVTVLEENSPHYGKSATVADLDASGVIVQCEVDGETIPFLRNEIGSEPKSAPASKPSEAPKAKPNAAAVLQSELDIERERVQILEQQLAELVNAIETRITYGELLKICAEAKTLL